MRSELFKKEVVFGIIVLCIGASIVPVISSESNVPETVNKNRDSTDWWPMFHHDIAHTGFSTTQAPSTNHVAWIFQTDMIVFSCPVVVDGKVYFGSNHKYYCLNAETGETIWECPTGGWAEGNPAVDNGKIYLVSRNQEGENKIFCLNAETGQYLWNYTDCYWPFNPVINEGMLYFGSLDGYVRCLDAEDGSFIWSYNTDSVGVSNCPTISDGKLYFGAGNGLMYCLNALTGNTIWSYPTNDKIMECAAVANGKVYFGSFDYNIYCLNANTGQFIWSYLTGFVVDTTPTILNGKVYVGSRDGTLYCLNADNGGYLWSFVVYGQVDSSPAIAEGKVYFGSDDSNVYCLDADTGAIIWYYMTGSFVMSSPAVAEGKVYIGSYDNNLYCFGGELVANFTWLPASPSHGQTVTFNASASYDTGGFISLYEWDWDDNGVYEETTTSPITTHLWSDPGSYPVKLRVTDNMNQVATVIKTVIIGNQPPDAPSITGPAKGKIKVAYEYNFTTTDPDGDTLYYLIDWGDGTNGSWIGPYESGAMVAVSHTWITKGSYTIQAMAKDSVGNESGWGTLSVTMPLTYTPPLMQFLMKLFERFPSLFPILRYLMGSF